ncbi:22673_t:CDS:2 [Racocetra persica]|uniref:22673_t:CDS:1 n=1 Tax=Racocetra persica TaxID=160502 RepID=A0ACA9P4E5_9GLOM|nr:22673_t:CDS:2 [Racocetra persica]
MSLKKTYIEEEIYIESYKKLDDEKKKYQRKEETYQKIISNLQNELENRNSTIIELIERYVYFNTHFGKLFEICQSLYEQDVLNKINESVKEEVQQEKVICQQQEEEVVYQQEETDDELDYNPDTE